MNFEERSAFYREETERELISYMNIPHCAQDRLIEAMRYSLTGGGKRIRAVITLEFARMCGGKAEAAMPAACAIEMMHAFSLIHDDLPCMDDDDMRRGKPSCHIAFDEATALLAGDALEIYPFKLIAESVERGVKAENALKMCRILSENAGHMGMTGGQIIDCIMPDDCSSQDDILRMYELKTSRLLQTAAVFGCLAADADEMHIKKADEYAKKVGLAFQIIDDILDICGDAETLGKPVGSDEQMDKKTYVRAVGIENARRYAEKLTDEAMSLLDGFDDNEFIRQFTIGLLNRNK